MRSVRNFEKQIINWLGIAVLVLGFFTIRSFRGGEAMQQNIDVISSPNSANANARSPAGVELVDDKSPAYQFSKSQTLVVKCDQLGKIEQLNGAHLRLLGNDCFNSTQITVKNITNGFTASVIPLRVNKYTTDFIDLNEGENVIEISHTLNDGSIQKKEIQSQRSIASEQP